MGYALILNTAYKASTTGGTFADSLAANSGDSLSVAQFDSPATATVTKAWGIDSDSAMELSWYYTREESTFDQTYGIRIQVPALFPGGAANVGSHDLLPGEATIPVFSGDTATMNVTTTAADDVLVSWLTEYSDLAGSSMQFISAGQCESLRDSQFGFYVNPTGGTAGVYGTGRALTADDDRFKADKWYALLGFTTQTPFTTLAISGPTLSGYKYGAPSGVLGLDNTWCFYNESKALGKPLIPFFGQADAKNMLAYIADGEASTAPKVDFHCYELSSKPTPGQ